MADSWARGEGVVLGGDRGSGRTRAATHLAGRVGAGGVVRADHGWDPRLGRRIIDDAEHLKPSERLEALAAGCVLVLPPTAAAPAGVPRVTLAPVDAPTVSALLHRVLGQPVSATAVARLAAVSGGNMRSLVELTRGSVESRALEYRDGAWQLVAEPRPTRLLLERVEQVLASLDEVQREAVELIALADPVPAAWLEAELGAAWSEVLACPLVTGGDLVGLLDDTTRVAVVDRMPSLRARRLARRLLDSTLGQPAARASWAFTAGRPIDPAEALAAARQLVATGQATEAQAVLMHTGQCPEVSVARAAIDLHLGLGPTADQDPEGHAVRITQACALLGPGQELDSLPGLPTDRGEPSVAWPVVGADWDPWPSPHVAEAIRSAQSGDFPRARVAARSAQAATSSGWAPDLVWACLALGWVALSIGLPATAARRGLEMAAAADALRWPGVAGIGRDMAAVAMGMRGIQGPVDPAPEPGDSLVRDWAALWRVRVLAWSSATVGDLHADALLRAARAALARGDVLTAIELASDARRVGRPQQALEILEGCTPSPPIAVPERHAAEAAVEGSPRGWAQAAQGFQSLGSPGRAAECFVQQGLALSGTRGAAAQARAEEVLAGCEGLRTPLTHRWGVALTGREREVAVMAGGGLPSSHIADQLGISVRTVDNLLSRCYAKLGVSGRRDLRAALGLDAEDRRDGGRRGYEA